MIYNNNNKFYFGKKKKKKTLHQEFWCNDLSLVVVHCSCAQNMSIISTCAPNGRCQDDLVHVSPDGAWNDLYTAPLFDKTGDSYLIILPGKQGNEGYYKVIYNQKYEG